MSVPYPTIRLVLSGDIAGAQTWSTGLRIAPTGGGAFPTPVNQAVLDTWATNRVVNARDLWSTQQGGTGQPLAGVNSGVTRLTALRAYLYPANSDQASLMSEPAFGTALVGTNSTALPTQTSLVASLRSGTPGRTGRGRMYLPLTAAALTADHRLSAAATANLATQVAAFLSAVGASQVGGSDIEVIVASTAGPRPVTSVEVDNRVDIQRRRADKIIATSSTTKPVTS